jgi:transposase
MLRMQNKQLDYTDKNIFIGMDVHKKSWKIHFICDGVEYKPIMTNSTPTELIKFLQRNFPNGNYHSAYEAGYSGYWIHESLEKEGIKSMIVHPPDIPVSQRDLEQKTDKRDSRKLARMLSAGQLEGIYTPDKEVQEYRQFMRFRQRLVRDRTRLKNRIKGVLSFIGVNIEDKEIKNWTKKYIAKLRKIEFKTVSGKYSFDILIGQYETLASLIKQYDKRIRELSKADKYKEDVELLRTMPGIDTLSAMILLTEIVEINRFTELEDLVSYFGLLPTEHSSGERQRNGRMSKRGNKFLKYIITEISWTAISKDPELARSYMEYKKRMPPQKAIIKIGRKVLSRIRHILEKREKYIIGKTLVK